MNSNRLLQLDLLRFLSIIGVVVIHATSAVVSSLPSQASFQFWLLISLNQAARFCVPAFIFISGVLTTYQRETIHKGTGQTQNYIQKKVMRLVIPYLFWSILFLILSGYKEQNDRSVLLFFWKLISGRAFWGGYFIIALVQLSILYIFILRFQLNAHWLLLISVLSLAITELVYYLGVLGGSTIVARALRASLADYRALFLPWIPFYFAGLYTGFNYDWLFNLLRRYTTAIKVTIVLLLLMSIFEFKLVLDLTNSIGNASEYFRISSMLFSMAVCALFVSIMPNNAAINQPVRLIANSSYGIYFLNDRLIYFLTSIFPVLYLPSLIASLVLLIMGLFVPICLYYCVIHVFPKRLRLILYGVTS